MPTRIVLVGKADALSQHPEVKRLDELIDQLLQSHYFAGFLDPLYPTVLVRQREDLLARLKAERKEEIKDFIQKALEKHAESKN